MKGRGKKQKFLFIDLKDDSVLIGSHGDAVIQISGTVDISGIIYCPKYTVTLQIKGDGKVVFRGICNRVIVKRMQGNCTLDLRDLTCKELRLEFIQNQSMIITGKTRVISQANLNDDAILHIAEKALLTRSLISGSSKIIHTALTADSQTTD
jgi:hypothetical protein